MYGNNRLFHPDDPLYSIASQYSTAFARLTRIIIATREIVLEINENADVEQRENLWNKQPGKTSSPPFKIHPATNDNSPRSIKSSTSSTYQHLQSAYSEQREASRVDVVDNYSYQINNLQKRDWFLMPPGFFFIEFTIYIYC